MRLADKFTETQLRELRYEEIVRLDLFGHNSHATDDIVAKLNALEDAIVELTASVPMAAITRSAGHVTGVEVLDTRPLDWCAVDGDVWPMVALTYDDLDGSFYCPLHAHDHFAS